MEKEIVNYTLKKVFSWVAVAPDGKEFRINQNAVIFYEINTEEFEEGMPVTGYIVVLIGNEFHCAIGEMAFRDEFHISGTGK